MTGIVELDKKFAKVAWKFLEKLDEVGGGNLWNLQSFKWTLHTPVVIIPKNYDDITEDDTIFVETGTRHTPRGISKMDAGWLIVKYGDLLKVYDLGTLKKYIVKNVKLLEKTHNEEGHVGYVIPVTSLKLCE